MSIVFSDGVYHSDECKLTESTETNNNNENSVGYNFPQQSSELDEKRNKVHEFIDSILPTENDKQCVLKYLSSSLANEKNNNILFLNGNMGSNGKTVLLDFYKKTTGKNFIYFEDWVFNNMTDSMVKERKLRQIEQTPNVNVICVEYNNINDLKNNIDTNFVNKILGKEINLIFFGNSSEKKLELENDQMITVNFPNKFVENPSNDDDLQRNCEMNEQLEPLCDAFMYELLEYYEFYVFNREK